MPSFTTVYRHKTRGNVEIEGNQRDGGERWSITAKNGMVRRQVEDFGPDPWSAVRDLVREVLNADQRDDSGPPRYDLNKKLARPVSSTVRRRGKYLPSGLPPWTAPTD
jgi:hypothetical protein